MDTLVHLEWLDISFNNIDKICGLEKLVNLRDLSLAHNRITVVENLEALVNLQVLSLASNLIEDPNCVRMLRQFSELISYVLQYNYSDIHTIHTCTH